MRGRTGHTTSDRVDAAADRFSATMLRGRPLAARAAWVAGAATETCLLVALARRSLRHRSLVSGGACATAFALERPLALLGKRASERDRPADRDHRPLSTSTRSSSFPSAHASSAFLAATLLAEDIPTVPVYAAAALVAASRVVLRLHHVSDVTTSTVVGVAVGLAVTRARG